MELSRDILDGWRHITKRRIILIQKFVVEPLADNFSRAFLNLTDVDEHSGHGIDRPGKNEIGGVIAPGAVARLCLGAECDHVFAIGPTRNKQTARGREFKTLADRQKHERSNTLPMITQ